MAYARRRRVVRRRVVRRVRRVVRRRVIRRGVVRRPLRRRRVIRRPRVPRVPYAQWVMAGGVHPYLRRGYHRFYPAAVGEADAMEAGDDGGGGAEAKEGGEPEVAAQLFSFLPYQHPGQISFGTNFTGDV